MKIVKIIALTSMVIACHGARAVSDSLVKAFYAEVSEAGKVGTSFDSVAIDRILSPEFILNDGRVVRSQSELKLLFADLKTRAGGWTITHLLTFPVIQEGACARILFLWSVPGQKDLVVDAHLYSSTGTLLDKMVATVVFKDECFKALAEAFLEGLKQGFSKWNVISRDAAVTFDSVTNSLVFTCVMANSQGQKLNLLLGVSDHQEKSVVQSA